MAWELSLDLDRVEANVEQATTEDLLDRATVYRNGMEPEALNLIDAELRARGVAETDLTAHRVLRARTVYAADGLAVKCERCRRPAVIRRWGWHLIGGLVPAFPRPHAFCDLHLPAAWRDSPAAPPSDAATPATPPVPNPGGEGVRPSSSSD